MKKYLYLLFAITVFLLPSCSKDAVFEKETKNIFGQIPKDSKVVVVVNLRNIAEKLKSNDNEDISDMLEEAMGSAIFNKIEPWVNKKTPLDFTKPAVAFEKDNQMYLTFFVRNEKAFRDIVDDEYDNKMKQRNGVWISGDEHIFQIGKQVWITSSMEAKPADFQKFKDFDESRSFVTLPAAQNLIERHSDLSILVNLKEASQFKVVDAELFSSINALANDPAYYEIFVDFEEGQITGRMALLNKKGEPAKASIPLEKINLGTFKQLPGKGSIFFAAGIDATALQPMIKKLSRYLDAEITPILEQLKGTSAFSLGFTDNYDMGCNAVVNTKSSQGAVEIVPYMNSCFDLQHYGQISTADQKILVSNPKVNGIEARDIASKFEDVLIGMAVSTKNLPDRFPKNISSYFPLASLLFKAENKGLVLELNIETEEGVNSLITICDFLAKIRKYY